MCQGLPGDWIVHLSLQDNERFLSIAGATMARTGYHP